MDLGCGIGSVGLMTLFHVDPTATLVGVEVQQMSIDLARRSVSHNGLDARVELVHSDLREFRRDETFDLITGSPPYIPADKGVHSPHPQRAGARMELKGDVFDYCRAAAHHLAPEGVFALCHAGLDPRPIQAIEAAGLKLLHRREVFFRADKPPTIALYLAGWLGDLEEVPPLVVRDADGNQMPDIEAVRALF